MTIEHNVKIDKLYEGTATCLVDDPPVVVGGEVYRIEADLVRQEDLYSDTGDGAVYYLTNVKVYDKASDIFLGEINSGPAALEEDVVTWFDSRWTETPKEPHGVVDVQDVTDIPPYDPVNHPEHYASGSLECIDWIKAELTEREFRGYLKGNVLKYLWRHEDKGNPVQDLSKAGWYLEKLKECFEESDAEEKYAKWCEEHGVLA